MRLALILTVLATPFIYSASSSALSPAFSRAFASRPDAAVSDQAAGVPGASLVSPLTSPPLAAAFQSLPEEIEAFEYDAANSTCSNTQKSRFAVGETVCAKVSGTLLGPRVIYWIHPDGTIVQTDVISQTSLTATRTVSARGPWRLYLSAGDDGSLRKATHFFVSDPAQAAADLSVVKVIDRNASAFAPGGNVFYRVYVANLGPDAASNVVLTDQVPNEATAVSSSQVSGPSFTCTNGGRDCTIASLAVGDFAVFSFEYQIDGGAAVGTTIDATATVSSDTVDPRQVDNSSTVTIGITDATAPASSCALECPNDIVVTATHLVDTVPSAVVEFEAEGSGDCGPLTSSKASGSTFAKGTTQVSVSAESGGSCTFTVTVVDPADSPAPTITCPADTGAVAGQGEVDASVSVGTPQTGGTVLSVVGVRSDGVARALTDPYSVGVTTITWTARDTAPDADGLFPPLTRSASCEQKITVTSSDAPTISCPANVEFTSSSGCEMTLTAAQIGTPTTGGTVQSLIATRGDNRAMSDPFPAGSTVVTWTARDKAPDAGGEFPSDTRTASCQQVITVKGSGADNTPPVLDVPPDVEALTDSCTALVDDELGVPTATDSCGGGVKINRTGVPTGTVLIRRRFPLPPLVVQRETFLFPIGTTIVTYTATDAAGNVTTGTQKVVVKERAATPPTFTSVPQDITVHTGPSATECGVNIDDATLGAAAATDNCPSGVTVERTGVPAGNFFPVGVTQITHTAKDASGNTATAVQKVTVIDNTPPAVAQANITQYLPLNSTATSTAVSYPAPTTLSDNCPGSSVSYSPPSGSTFQVGTWPVTATATDAHNNSTQITFTVTVLYNFTGFFTPVQNGTPTSQVYNLVKAGQSVPMKFSLSGAKGLDIFGDAPTSVQIACPGDPPINDMSELDTLAAGSSGLTYDALSDQYTYVWKTESPWVGTCRQFNLKLNDGSVHSAYFKFK